MHINNSVAIYLCSLMIVLALVCAIGTIYQAKKKS